MDRMLVMIFRTEADAYRGATALRELDAEGSITLYSAAVIAKGSDGSVSVKRAAEEGPAGTAVGLLTGSLLGLFAGPVGLAVAVGAGTLGGLLYDLARVGVNDSFLDEASRQLEPGKVAVVAEAWEEWVTPVDTRIEEVGGVVLRRVRGEVIDSQIERDVKTLRTELTSLRDEQSRALKEQRGKLDAKIARAKSELYAAQDRAKAALDAATREGEAKLRLLEGRLGQARGDVKTKIDARIKATRAEYQRRSELLRQALELARQAVEG
ncbi:MAG TPA: DUF1269 domain-containing protein [Polyangia bacterium]|nr:DUF1269 domain-containing protein [Polyangia bacterium]